MTRDEMIETMCDVAFIDQIGITWRECREAGNKSLWLVRERMARVLDAIEPLIRADERAATGGLPCTACLECGARVEFPNLYYCRNQSCIEKRAPRP